MHLLRAVGLLLFSGIACAIGFGGQLVSGPMLGYQAHREALIWVETRGAQTVTLEYALAGRPETRQQKTLTDPAVSPAGTQPIKFVLPLLEMGQRYEGSLLIDGERQTLPAPFAFRTTAQWEWRSAPPDFSFLFGSCAYINETLYDRPGKPYGKSYDIFRHMAASGADFMLWGGDNVYLREADFSSESGIWHRYSHARATPELQPLLAAMPHYAVWDDHDYGSDNANRSFEFKAATTAAFRAYWGNATWGEPDNAGVYGKFFWGDAVFLLLDNRTHRDDSDLRADLHPQKTQYGARQLDWLKQSLLQAKELGHFKFKFIVTGSQVLQTLYKGETAEVFPRERDEIFRFLREQDITGVVFLTGDVHHSGLYRQRLDEKAPWIYEVTSSPLTSGATDVARAGKEKEPRLVPGTLVGAQNYCRIAVRGPKGQREVFVQCFDATNTLRWEHVIPETDLR